MLDDDGLTPIQAAIGSNDVGMVADLLKRDDLKLGDAILHAVEKGNRIIVEMILLAMRKRKMPADGSYENTTHFKFYMTPLMLACLEENYDLVGLFLRAGHVLYLPHGGDCGCVPCTVDHPKGEKLETKMRRIDQYAAASSLAFVLHQEDPFDYAMSLSSYLEECKNYDPSYGSKYDEMINKLGNATVSLIADCDQQEMIESVLNGRHKGFADNECVFGYPRVEQALRSHQKQFIAQASCQSVIYDAYRGTWRDMFQCKRLTRFVRWTTHTVFYPFSCLLFVLSVGKFPDSYKNPLVRFTASFCSYVTFLATLIFYTQYKEERSHLGSPTMFSKKLALCYLYAYIAGLWTVVLTDLRRMGVRRCFDVWWRRFDFLFLVVWTFTLFAFSDALIHAAGHRHISLHRVHWSVAEPQLIYEIWFTWAAIMSSVRLFYYGQLLSHFGSVTIAISRCIPTILRYVVVLFVVLASFAIGLNHLYEHYKDNVVIRGDKEVVQPFQLTSLYTTARYLYWAFYGYITPDVWGVIVGNAGFGSEQGVVEMEHQIITNTGELMAGVYHVVELIILLNLMVAIMTAAAMAVMDTNNADWKVVRVEIWTEFFHDSRAVPPPFNLMQWSIHGSIFVFRKLTKRPGPLSAWDYKHSSPMDDPKKEQKYMEMVSSLKDRLRLKLNDEKNGPSPPKSTNVDEPVGQSPAPMTAPLITKSEMPSKKPGKEGTASSLGVPSGSVTTLQM